MKKAELNTHFVKVKATGVVYPVSTKYFERYEMEGWFIEVSDPNIKIVRASPRTTKK